MKKIDGVSGVVLAGGKSTRMGRDKRCLPWNGVKLLDSICAVMDQLFDELIVVTAVSDYELRSVSVRSITDEIPGKGSIGGLFSGILHGKNPYSFVVACDMPYLHSEVVERICLSPPADIVVVNLLQGVQPLHARYSKKCLPYLEEMIRKDHLKIQELLVNPALSSIVLDESQFSDLDPHLRSFINVNTPSDWEFARKAQRNLPV